MPFHLSMRAAVAMAVFAIVSVIIGAGIAAAAGWRGLAERYPALPGSAPAGERYAFASMRTLGGPLGGASYGGCVTVVLSPRGMAIALWAPFRLFHAPLFIPWQAVETCAVTDGLRGERSALVTLKDGARFRVYGKAAEAISMHLGQHGDRPPRL
jgi:hypothetical protein